MIEEQRKNSAEEGDREIIENPQNQERDRKEHRKEDRKEDRRTILFSLDLEVSTPLLVAVAAGLAIFFLF